VKDIQEIILEKLNPEEFVEKQIKFIQEAVGDKIVISALSGGVDSAVATLLAHQALKDQLKVVFVENGLMRINADHIGEANQIKAWFKNLGIEVQIIEAKDKFFHALEGIECPECKRKAITETFYKDIFANLISDFGAKILIQGTNFIDVKETVAGIKSQHNVLEQIGINPERTYGYKVIEPIIQLSKPAIRKVGRFLGLPKEISERPPFPGPALATRIIGEVTHQRVAFIRKATAIVEEELAHTGAFQYLAILHKDKATGIHNNNRDFGHQIEVRCWNSEDAVTATPTKLEWDILLKIGKRISNEVPGVVSVTYNIASKPPSCIEAI